MNLIMKTLRSLLSKCIDDIDSGNCALTDEEANEALLALQKFSRKDTPISKYEACQYLGMSRATFDNKVKNGELPEGKKQAGLKEKTWLRSELDKYIKK